MKKKVILLVGLAIVIVGLITTSSVLGYVAYQKNDDVKDLKQQVEELGLQVEEDKDGNNVVTNTTDTNDTTTDDTTGTCPETLTFTDTGMEVYIDYPISWTPTQNVEVNASTAPVQIDKYEVRFAKSGATLFFSKMMGGVGGLTMAIQSTAHEYYILPGFTVTSGAQTYEIMRYREIGGSTWRYVPVGDCSNLPTGETSDVNICFDPFIPNFGMQNFASAASLSNASDVLLAEADEILKSAIDN
jgi:archaellum component FlaG (FlaF/FlaG flagellin family)